MNSQRLVCKLQHITRNHLLGSCGVQLSSRLDVRVGHSFARDLFGSIFSALFSKVVSPVIIFIFDFCLLWLVTLNLLYVTFIIFTHKLGLSVDKKLILSLEKWCFIVGKR